MDTFGYFLDILCLICVFFGYFAFWILFEYFWILLDTPKLATFFLDTGAGDFGYDWKCTIYSHIAPNI